MELMGISELVIILFAVLCLIVWVVALVSIIRNEFPGSERLIWILLVIFVPFIGTILYFVIGRNRRIKPNHQ